MRTAFLLLVFLASFLAVSAGVRRALGWPATSGLRAKLMHYESDPEGFDVLFVGSSNVMNSIQPERFDAMLAARGIDVRSYNLGLPGMLAFEIDYVLQEVLARRSERLRWVIVELMDWHPSPRIAEKTARGVYWHTFERVEAMADAAFHYEGMSTRARLAFVRDHFELALWRLTNVGRVQELLMLELGLRAEDDWNAEIDPTREGGYIALEETNNLGAAAGRKRFLADRNAYMRRLVDMRRRAPPTGAPPSYLARSAARRLASFEGTGVEPIHVVLPSTATMGDVDLLGPPSGPFRELWTYIRPDVHPDLFQLRNRYDDRHLMRSGADVLTALIAERFADHLEAGTRR